MLPGVPDNSTTAPREAALAPARWTRPRPGWLAARDAAATAVGSGVAGLVVSVEAHSALVGGLTGGAIWVISAAGVAFLAWLRRFRRASGDAIDPWALPEPWRGLTRDAVNAGRRFEVAAASLPPGPLRDRVTSLEPALAHQVRAVWEAAQRGAALTGGYPPGNRPESASSLSEQLQALQRERASLVSGSASRLAELDRAEEATASRLREAKRAESVALWLRDGLRSAIARLERAVTSLAEIGGESTDVARGEEVGGSLTTVAEELSALQAGLREVGVAVPSSQGLPRSRSKP